MLFTVLNVAELLVPMSANSTFSQNVHCRQVRQTCLTYQFTKAAYNRWFVSSQKFPQIERACAKTKQEGKNKNHRLTLPKGVYSLRYFLSPMRIPNLVMHIFILPNSFIVCSCMYASLLQLDLNAYTRYTH